MATARTHVGSPAKADKTPAPIAAGAASQEQAPLNPAWSLLATQLQPKLTVSTPDDPYEREADAMAERVMRMPDASAVASTAALPSPFRAGAAAVHRKCKACEDEETVTVQRKCAACEEEDEEKQQKTRRKEEEPATVHRQRRGGGRPRPSADLAVQRVVASPGRPLEPAEREYFEPRFNADFSRVRVHTGGDAAHAAESIHARAFTVGPNVVFARNEYSPGSAAGRHLLAHELTHVAQQGHAPVRGQRAPAVRPAAAPPGVQRSPGDDPGLLEQLNAQIAAANADWHQNDDVAARAHGARLSFLYKFIAHPQLTSQQVLDDYISRMEKEAKNELDTLTDAGNPFTADFALEQIPEGFPLMWAGRIRWALSLGVDYATLFKEWKDAYDKLAKSSDTLAADIFEHGLPVPLEDPSRLQRFKLRVSDAKATNSTGVSDYAKDAIVYVKLKWMVTFIFMWEKSVDQFHDAVQSGEVIVTPAGYKDWIEKGHAKFLELPERARQRLAMTEDELKQFQTDTVSLDDAAVAIGMVSAFVSLFGILGAWNDASDLFDGAIAKADGMVASASGSERIIVALKWAWANSYFSGAAAEWAQNLIAHGGDILKEIGVILVLNLIPGVNILVDAYLLLTMARDVVHMTVELGLAIEACTKATTVVALQEASMNLARILVNGGIFIAIVLLTEGIGKAASRLKKEAAELRAADKELTQEAAEKQALEKLSKEERAALESGTAKLVKKFEQEIGVACSLGSIRCRIKLPEHIEKEAGAYPKDFSVPKPEGPFSVQKAALTGVERGTQLLRDKVLEDPSLWTSEFRKALSDARKKGLEWPVDSKGAPWEVHHVKPVFMGGDNTATNLIPLPRGVHQTYTNWWNAIHRAFKKRFTDKEWGQIYKKDTKDVAGSSTRKTPLPK